MLCPQKLQKVPAVFCILVWTAAALTSLYGGQLLLRCWVFWCCKAKFSPESRLNTAQLDFGCWLGLLLFVLEKERDGWMDVLREWGGEKESGNRSSVVGFLSHIHRLLCSGVSHFLLISPVCCFSRSFLHRLTLFFFSFVVVAHSFSVSRQPTGLAN